MNVITEYVRRIKDEVKEPNNTMLSTSVFASLTESTGMKKQDWKSLRVHISEFLHLLNI